MLISCFYLVSGELKVRISTDVKHQIRILVVPEAVVVLKVVVGVVFSDPRFQDEPFVIAGVAGGEAMESFGDLMVDQPIQLNPGGIGFRTFLKMKVGMVCGFIAGIVGVLRIQENWCLLVEPDDSWSFWWIWEFLGFGLEEGTE